jgi:hypothetical protein
MSPTNGAEVIKRKQMKSPDPGDRSHSKLERDDENPNSRNISKHKNESTNDVMH